MFSIFQKEYPLCKINPHKHGNQNNGKKNPINIFIANKIKYLLLYPFLQC